METTKEKKDSWTAFHALRPRIPRARGIKVMAFKRTNMKMGIIIFFNLDFPRAENDGLFKQKKSKAK